jgi:hypothetical protein
METNRESITGKTEFEMVGRCVWRLKGAVSEKLEAISNGQKSLEWPVWESQNPQRDVVLIEEELLYYQYIYVIAHIICNYSVYYSEEESLMGYIARCNLV